MMDGKPYPLPKTWAESSIGKAVVKTKQRDPRKKPDEVFQYVDVSAVSNTSFKITGAAPTLGSEAPSRARKAIQTDDVLFATVRPTLKRIALVPPELDGAIASTGYCILRCDNSKADPGFLYSFLITDHFNARMAGLERGASYPAVRDSDVTASWFPLPPLPEQKKIAHILSTVQRAIESQERIIQTTTELKKALMHKLFTEGLPSIDASTGGLRHEPQKQTEIGHLPESWEVVPLGELVNFTTGKLNSNAAVEDGEYPFFTCSKETFWIDHYAFDTEAILLSGNNAQAIYSVKHYKGKFNAYQRTYVITVKDTARISYRFLSQMLSRSLERLRVISIGSSTKYLTLGLLLNLPVAIPTYADGVKIGDWLDTIDQKIKEHEAKRKTLQDLFRTLLYELMTSKTRVHKLEISA
jgi:type I restriction enzyme S subunit